MLNIEEEGEGGRREWNVEMRLSRVWVSEQCYSDTITQLITSCIVHHVNVQSTKLVHNTKHWHSNNHVSMKWEHERHNKRSTHKQTNKQTAKGQGAGWADIKRQTAPGLACCNTQYTD
jgi:hypothetical protein